MASKIQVVVGLVDTDRKRAAGLYDDAFGDKLGIAIKTRESRVNVLAAGFNLSHAITAVEGNYLVGLAGFTTKEGALTGNISRHSIAREIGFFKSIKAAILLGLFDRSPRAGELLMDGIAVDGEYRGQGIGTTLFEALIHYAQDNGYKAIRLDVIDTNPSARRLYDRLGFVAERTNTFEVLRPLLGFGAATTMVYKLAS